MLQKQFGIVLVFAECLLMSVTWNFHCDKQQMLFDQRFSQENKGNIPSVTTQRRKKKNHLTVYKTLPVCVSEPATSGKTRNNKLAKIEYSNPCSSKQERAVGPCER